jgi:hypothetical protein
MALTTLRELSKVCSDQAEIGEDEGLPVLWQFLPKKHLAPKASRDECVAFVHQHENSFADEMSVLGQRWWDNRDITNEDIEDAKDKTDF